MTVSPTFVSDLEAGVYTPPTTARLPLREFCGAVEAAIPGVKTHLRNYSAAWVYNPYDLITMGQIKVVEGTRKSGSYTQFVVASNHIQNEKYGRGTLERNTVSRKHLADAVKAAVTYLKPPTPTEVAFAAMHMFTKPYRGYEQEMAKQRGNLATELFGAAFIPRLDTRMFRDLMTMREGGMRFLDAETEQMFSKFIELSTDLAAIKNDKGVRVILVRQNTVTTGIYPRISIYESHPMTEVQHFRPEETPPHIAERVAVLDLMGEGNYLRELGMKAKEGIYYATI
jgi:hypothetical protein